MIDEKKLAVIVGELLEQQAKQNQAWSSTPRLFENDDCEDVPNTWTMDYDGRIDLVKFADALLNAVKASP